MPRHASFHFLLLIGFVLSLTTPLVASEPVRQPLLATYVHPNKIIPLGGTPEEQSAAIRNSLDRIQRSGFNSVFPYFTGSSGQAYYRGKIHQTLVYGDRDPLDEFLREARARNLQVYPVVCVAVCGNDKPAGILLEHPEWGCRHPDGSPLGYISPAHPDARTWLVSIAREIADNYHPDGIILDYIRYHNRPLRLDVAAERRFQSSLPPDCTPEEEQKRLQQFKEDELTELVKLYSESLHPIDCKLGIYSWGPHVAANHQIAQCWPRWVAADYLDLVNVSGYYHRDKYGDKFLKLFEEKMAAAVQLNRDTGRPVPLSFALGVETSHGRIHSAEEVRAYLNKAAEVHLDGFVVFSWDDIVPFLDELDRTNSIRDFPVE